MKVLSASKDGINQAIEVLRKGGVVAHATETCYGLACDLTNPKVVERLFAVKRRPATQPVSALFASMVQAKLYLEWNALAEKLAQNHLPGPLTIILKLRMDAPHHLSPIPNPQSPIPNIGLRLSSHPTAIKLVTAFGAPISTTSANVHGNPNPYAVEDILDQYDGATDVPDLVLDDGPLPHIDASTVVDVSSGVLNVLRTGTISLP